MNESQSRQNNLLDTTDSLEAIGVFKGWKNFFFVIVLLCLLSLQAFFWLINAGIIKIDAEAPAVEKIAKSNAIATMAKETEKPKDVEEQVTQETEEIKKAAERVTAEFNQPAEIMAPETQQQPDTALGRAAKYLQTGALFSITFERLAWIIRFVNFVLILTAVLYCLTMLFSLKVSLMGRLGGISHISRAFFLSLVMVVLLLPWQCIFSVSGDGCCGFIVVGAIYTVGELKSWCAAEAGGIFDTVLLYLRFTGYWLLVLLLLIFAQLRSSRWAQAILRRLEVI